MGAYCVLRIAYCVLRNTVFLPPHVSYTRSWRRSLGVLDFWCRPPESYAKSVCRKIIIIYIIISANHFDRTILPANIILVDSNKFLRDGFYFDALTPEIAENRCFLG